MISTSKIKKITAIRKNRKENGRRADPLGSNPHSNGEFFSRSRMVFLAKSEEIIITKRAIIRVIITIEERIKIISSGKIQTF